MSKRFLTIIVLSVAFINVIVANQLTHATKNDKDDRVNASRRTCTHGSSCDVDNDDYDGLNVFRCPCDYEEHSISEPSQYWLMETLTIGHGWFTINYYLQHTANKGGYGIFLGAEYRQYSERDEESCEIVLKEFTKKGSSPYDLNRSWDDELPELKSSLLSGSHLSNRSFRPSFKTPLSLNAILKTCKKILKACKTLEVSPLIGLFKEIHHLPHHQHEKVYSGLMAFFQPPTETELSLPHQVHTIERHSHGFILSFLPHKYYNNLDSESESIDKIELKESQGDTKIVMSDSNDTEKDDGSGNGTGRGGKLSLYYGEQNTEEDDGSGNGTGRGGKLFVYYRDPSFIRSVYMKKRKRSEDN